MEVATEILRQLGGKRFVAMTGAKNLLAGEKSLSFSIGRNSSRANKVRIELAANDTYTVAFSRFAKLDLTELKRVTDVYCDKLQEVFTEFTGLQTSL